MNLIWVYEDNYIQYQHLNLLKMKKILLLGLLLITSITNAQTSKNIFETTEGSMLVYLTTDEKYRIMDEYTIHLFNDYLITTNNKTNESKITKGLQFQYSEIHDNVVDDIYKTDDSLFYVIFSFDIKTKKPLNMMVTSKNVSVLHLFKQKR